MLLKWREPVVKFISPSEYILRARSFLVLTGNTVIFDLDLTLGKCVESTTFILLIITCVGKSRTFSTRCSSEDDKI